MSLRYLLPLLALAGLGIAVFTVIKDDHAAQQAGTLSPTAVSPFASYIEGTGITEASTGNIAIGTPVSGVASAIYVGWGQEVAAGSPLFKIEDRDVRAQLLPAAARVAQADADLAKAKNLLRIATDLKVGSSITKTDLDNRRYDVAIKEAALGAARAQVEQLNIELARRTVRAPVAGRVLQINIRVGEYAQSGSLNPPLMLFGNDRTLYLRVNVDQDDAWRVRATAPAMAFIRGNPALKVPLKFVRFDPYVVPKPSLTGSSTERPDMRVLQVVYSFDHAALPVYVGEQMDAFIEASPANGAGTTPRQHGKAS